MIGQFAATLAKGTAAARNGKAEATTTRLIALLRITACRAAKRNAPISGGSRNSDAAEADQSPKDTDDCASGESNRAATPLLRADNGRGAHGFVGHAGTAARK
jgi:hypothetical protein